MSPSDLIILRDVAGDALDDLRKGLLTFLREHGADIIGAGIIKVENLSATDLLLEVNYVIKVTR